MNERFIEMGLNGIITDYPDRLTKVLINKENLLILKLV